MLFIADYGPATPNIIEIVIEYSNNFNINPALVLAIIEQESDFDLSAERFESNINDYSIGLMQILIKTAIEMGYISTQDQDTDRQELKNIYSNLYYGIKYLKTRLNLYKNLPLKNAIMTYNSGSPLYPTSPYYESNNQYGNNVMEYYNKWQNRLKLDTKSDIIKNIIFSGVIGGLFIYVDKKLYKG